MCSSDLARGLQAVRAAFVHPCDVSSLQAAFSVRDTGFMEPVLIGPETRLRALIEQHKLKLGTTRIINAQHSQAAAAHAVEMARDEDVEALVQGSLTTEELLRAVRRPCGACRTCSTSTCRATRGRFSSPT